MPPDRCLGLVLAHAGSGGDGVDVKQWHEAQIGRKGSKLTMITIPLALLILLVGTNIALAVVNLHHASRIKLLEFEAKRKPLDQVVADDIKSVDELLKVPMGTIKNKDATRPLYGFADEVDVADIKLANETGGSPDAFKRYRQAIHRDIVKTIVEAGIDRVDFKEFKNAMKTDVFLSPKKSKLGKKAKKGS